MLGWGRVGREESKQEVAKMGGTPLENFPERHDLGIDISHRDIRLMPSGQGDRGWMNYKAMAGQGRHGRNSRQEEPEKPQMLWAPDQTQA